MKECRNPKTCRHCSQQHHQSVCLLCDQERRDQEKSAQKEATPPEIKTTTTSVHSKSRGTVLLETMQAMAVNNQNSANTNVRILLDTGSQRSYVTNRLKTKLNLSPVKSETLHLNTFGEESYKKQQCDVVNLHSQGAHGEIEVSALCFQKICSPVSAKINVDNYIHLQGLELADSSIVDGDNQNIDVLIGSDYYYDVVSGDVVRGDSGPVAISSMFGWILSGHASEAEARDKFSTTNLIIEHIVSPFDILSENDELTYSLQKFWDTGSLGVQYATKVPQVDGDEFLRDMNFDEVERRYEVGLPWKEGCFPASDEYGTCVTRLRQLHTRLKKNKELLRDYNNVIEEKSSQGSSKQCQRMTMAKVQRITFHIMV